VRAAAVDLSGRIERIVAREHDQIVPQFGWAEQQAEAWWDGVAGATHELVNALPSERRIVAVAACGQMHGTVLIDTNGKPTRSTVPLWNDKRTTPLVASFEAQYAPEAYLRDCGNPPTPAWPAFKLAWLRDNDPDAYARATVVLMPKDFINYRLTGNAAIDPGDASLSFLMDPRTATWSAVMIDRLGLAPEKLPPIRSPLDWLGTVTADAAAQTGVAAGTPVLVGGGDYPMALLGSGVCRPGIASDVTGTSCIVTVDTRTPILDTGVCNVATIEGNWGSFILFETGGDAVRWARRALYANTLDYAGIMAEAATAPAGADGLFFLPFLTGERLGSFRNARAQFFGLAAAHGRAHLDRAIIEGVAFAGARALRMMETAAGTAVERVIASSGGAKSELWLKIKASAYNIPLLVPAEAECGIVGCAASAATALGHYANLDAAVTHCVRYSHEVVPEPAWAERYARMQPIFDTLYTRSQALYGELDRLAE
jgi:xylulokinase